jgi:hypothetical protein
VATAILSFVPSPKKIFREPPSGAPEATQWFGGPVDRWKVALRVFGEELDPERVSALLGCQPTSARRKGDPFPKKGRWLLEIYSKDCDQNADVDDGIRMLLARLTADNATWLSLTSTYAVDIFCGLFMATFNRGFGISCETSKQLSDRHLEIGFDLYFDPMPAPPSQATRSGPDPGP